MEEVSAREAFMKFKPEACVFVTSVNSEGKPNGMIAGWNMKCSADPALFAVSLSKRGNTKDLIRESKEFSIAVPNKDLIEAIKVFGSMSGKDIDKFEKTGIETFPAKYIKSPLLNLATINMECQLIQEIDAGDHVLFLGKVIASYVDKDKKVLLNMRKVNDERVYEEF